MKHLTRILAYSALALIVVLAAFAAIAPATSSVAYAQAPDLPPTLSAAKSGANSIDLTWNVVPGADRYEIKSWTEADGYRDLGATTNAYTDSGLTAGRAYYYWVRAVSAGAKSGWSNRADAAPGNTTVKPVLTVTPGYLQNVLTWDEVSGAARYEVWARISSSDSAQQLDDGSHTALTYTDSGLTAGALYYYWVRVINDDGSDGLWSARKSGAPMPLPAFTAPQNLQVAPGDTQATLTWQAPASSGGQTITGYEYRYRQTGGTFPAIWTDAGDDLTETVTGLTNGVSYDFEVWAVTSGGGGPAASVTLSPAAFTAPQALQVTPGDTQATLTWQAPASSGDQTITGYEYRYGETGGALPDTWTADAGNDLTETVTGLTNGKEYTFEVRAVASDSVGPAASDTQTLATVPGVPVLDASGEYRQIVLTWTAPDNGGAAITSYRIEIQNDQGDWDPKTGVPDDVFTYTDDRLSDAKQYTYRIFAVNDSGDSDWDSASAFTLAHAPAAPSAPLNVML